MAKVSRILAVSTCALVLALTIGFAIFATALRSAWHADASPVSSKADGIVVLTGGDERITTGLELMADGRGRRLLISGVNRANKSPEELSRRIGEALPACCIDLGYQAINTIGNADEASNWASHWGFRSILVVTSDFHMARSLVEFSRAMPGIELIAHPVPSRYSRQPWWSSRTLAQTLAGEYVKFLASSARLGAVRMIGACNKILYVEQPAERAPPRPGEKRLGEKRPGLSTG